MDSKLSKEHLEVCLHFISLQQTLVPGLIVLAICMIALKDEPTVALMSLVEQ